jgi:glutaredoxin
VRDRRRFTRVPLVHLLVACFALGGTPACKPKSSSGATKQSADVPPPSLASIVVRDDSKDLTFSFITLDGGFKTVRTVAEVPYEARDAVRVWNDVSGDGVAGPWVYVADLRSKLPDGSYKVDVVARAKFDEMAEDRRQKAKAQALADKAQPASPPPDDTDKPPDNGSAPGGGTKGKLVVIIYGADWCKPCHQAEAYLKSRGIAYVHKDVDDPNVHEELADKLYAAGMQTNSIPVLDVAGKILVGFAPDELDRAIEQALAKG